MIVKCPECHFEKEVYDNTIIAVCPICLNKMEEKEDGRRDD